MRAAKLRELASVIGFILCPDATDATDAELEQLAPAAPRVRRGDEVGGDGPTTSARATRSSSAST